MSSLKFYRQQKYSNLNPLIRNIKGLMMKLQIASHVVQLFYSVVIPGLNYLNLGTFDRGIADSAPENVFKNLHLVCQLSIHCIFLKKVFFVFHFNN